MTNSFVTENTLSLKFKIHKSYTEFISQFSISKLFNSILPQIWSAVYVIESSKIAPTLHKTSHKPLPLIWYIWEKLYLRRLCGEGDHEEVRFSTYPQIFCIADTLQVWEEMAVVWSEHHYNAPDLQYATQLAVMGP